MRGLGQLEATVMAHVWRSEDAVTVRDVLGVLRDDRPLAYTTVMTVMDHLHTKGLLHRQRVGRAYAYRAARSREEHEAELMQDVLAASPDRSATLMHFVEKISPAELEELRNLISAEGEAEPR